jgi:hypothetical protein
MNGLEQKPVTSVCMSEENKENMMPVKVKK